MVAGGVNSTANATNSIAIGTNVRISSSASNAVAVSAYTSKSCATTEPGSLTLCADKNVTIEGSALVVNGVDVLMATSNLEAELLNTKAELADLKAKVAALDPVAAFCSALPSKKLCSFAMCRFDGKKCVKK